MSTLNGYDWDHLDKLATYYAGNNPTSDNAVMWQIIKLMEESGELASAYISYRGQNPRKGDIPETLHDVIKECCDVIITGLVALSTLSADAESAFAERWDEIKNRTMVAVNVR